MRPRLAGAWHSPQDFREQFPALSFHASAQRIIPAAVGSCPSKCSRLMLLVAPCICPEDRLSKPKALGTLRRHVQMLKVYLAVMVVGAFGCAARMWLSNLLEEKYGPAFPIGTLAVNVLGCFIIGVFAGITRPDGGVLVHPVIRQAVIIGFLGGFTTFSSFGLQTISPQRWGMGLCRAKYHSICCAMSGGGVDWPDHRRSDYPRMKSRSQSWNFRKTLSF